MPYRPLPTARDPFVEVRALGAERRLGAVAGPDRRVGAVHVEDPLVDRGDDRGEVATFEGRVPRTAGEERVAVKSMGVSSSAKEMLPGV